MADNTTTTTGEYIDVGLSNAKTYKLKLLPDCAYTCQICGKEQPCYSGTWIPMAICDRCRKVLKETVENHKSSWGV